MTQLLLPATVPVNVRALRSLAVACDLRRKRVLNVILDDEARANVRAVLYMTVMPDMRKPAPVVSLWSKWFEVAA